MHWNLYLKTTLNKNNITIHILHSIYLNKYGKSHYNKNCMIHIKDSKNQTILVKDAYTTDIEKALLEFGCSPDEIEGFINIAKFKVAHKYNLKFIINDYYYEGAKFTLDYILAGSKHTLTDVQKKILKNELKHEITYNEYISLPKSEQEIYDQDTPDYTGIYKFQQSKFYRCSTKACSV